MYVTWAPWSNDATSKAERVRVEVFSKIKAISLPSSRFTSVPAYFATFRASESWSKNRSSRGSKSISFRKLRLRRLNIVVVLARPCVAQDTTGRRSSSERLRPPPSHPWHHDGQ